MKTTQAIILLAAIVLLAACDRQEQPNEPAKPASSVSVKDAQEQAKEAAIATKEYLSQTKDQAVATVEKQLQEMDARISELAGKAKGYTGAAKTEADEALATLRDKREAAAGKLAELKSATQEKWQDVKAGFDTAMKELEKSFSELKAKFTS